MVYSQRKKPVPPSPPSPAKSPFSMGLPTTTLPIATGSNKALEDPYFLNGWGGDSGSSSYLEFGEFKPQPSLETLMDKNFQFLPPVQRNPITSITKSTTNDEIITITTERGINYELKKGPHIDLSMDNKRLRRILSNRISAQKSKLRKTQHVNDMEKMALILEKEIEELKSRIESEKDKRNLLVIENMALKEMTYEYEGVAEYSQARTRRNLVEVHNLREKVNMMSKEELRSALGKIYVEEKKMIEYVYEYVGLGKVINWDLYDTDPELAFTTLTIDPPQSLM